MYDPHAEYAAIPAINWSSLKPLAESPLAFRYAQSHPREDTDALFFGRALHCAVLEPDKFHSLYVIAPDFGDLRAVQGRTTKEEGKANKERRNEWRAANANKIPLDAEDGYRIQFMSEAIRNHRAAWAAIQGATEQTIQWNEPDFGLACKARLDILGIGVRDLKTANDVSPRGFGNAAAKYLYHGMAAWYHDGAIAAGRCASPDLPLLIATQNCPPWDVAVYRVNDEAMKVGRALYRRLVRRLVECTNAEWWPGVAPEILPLQLPYHTLNPDTHNDFDSEDF